MRAVEVFSATSLCALTTLGVLLALLLPDANTPSPFAGRRSAFRLPQGSERTSSRRWVWQNQTVRGVFTVYSAGDAAARPGGDRAAAGSCCGQLDGRLYAPESYEIEATTVFGAAAMSSTFGAAAAAWESIVGDRFGSQSTVGQSAGLVFNGRNQIGLGALDVDVSGALAVTGLWMTCPGGGSVGGCATALQIAEWDQTYAFAEVQWSLAGASGAYDLLSVATHEFGHCVGLDDLTEASCAPSTMYGSSGTGETFRRSIDDETKACAKDLYGISRAGAPWSNAALIVAALAMF